MTLHGPPPGRIREADRHVFFDVPAWHWPYPFGDSLRLSSEPRPSEDVSTWLSPEDFTSLLLELPRVGPDVDPRAYVQAVEHRFKGKPLETFPVLETVRRLRLWADADPM